MGEVRKLHKKLRQIENLEIKPFLTQEERDKVHKNLAQLHFIVCVWNPYDDAVCWYEIDICFTENLLKSLVIIILYFFYIN